MNYDQWVTEFNRLLIRWYDARRKWETEGQYFAESEAADKVLSLACDEASRALVDHAARKPAPSDGWRTSADGLSRVKIAPDAAAPMVPTESRRLFWRW